MVAFAPDGAFRFSVGRRRFLAVLTNALPVLLYGPTTSQLTSQLLSGVEINIAGYGTTIIGRSFGECRSP